MRESISSYLIIKMIRMLFWIKVFYIKQPPLSAVLRHLSIRTPPSLCSERRGYFIRPMTVSVINTERVEIRATVVRPRPQSDRQMAVIRPIVAEI